jgi:hypothetical protein
MRTAGVLLILVCAASLPVSAQETTEGEVATAIRALEHQWFEAQSRHDNRALDLIFDNALVYVEYGRLITKGDYLLQVKAAKPGASQISMEAMTVHTFGEAAIVVGSYRDNSALSGKSVRWRFVDTWVRKNGRWMLVAAAAAPFAK